MKPLLTGLMAIFLITGVNLGRAAERIEYPETKDINVLIYSNSHLPESNSGQTAGSLNFQISAFANIIQVDINGIIVEQSGGTSVEINYPFTLADGDNAFVVSVVTDQGLATQTYHIFKGEKPVQRKKPFHLVGVLGISSIDNVDSVSDSGTKESATKASVFLIPSYDIDLSGTSLIKLKAIMTREKYGDDQYSSKEIAYHQVAAQWIERESGIGSIYAEGGINDVKTDESNESDESKLELFVGGGLHQIINKKMSWSASAEYKTVDSKLEVSDSGDEEDGSAFDLVGKLYLRRSGINGTGKLGYGLYDALGDYKDYSMTELGVKAVYPLNPWVPSLELSLKNKTLANEDPRIGKAQADLTTTYQLKVAYMLLSSFQLALGYRSKTVSSNLESAAYSASTIKFTAIYVY